MKIQQSNFKGEKYKKGFQGIVTYCMPVGAF